MAEMFDLVDEFDRPLGVTKLRSAVHQELSDWHRVTVIYILNSARELLCQKRSMTKDVEPGIWQCFFGGHVKSGQSYSEAAVSELFEELGLRIKADELFYLGTHKNPHSKHHCGNFLHYWNGAIETLSFPDGEVDEVRWLSLAEFKQMKISQGFEHFQFNPLLLEYFRTLELKANNPQS